MPRQGEGFHTLVHAIERAIAITGLRIEAPKMMPDKDTGQQREHDIVLTFTEHHHEMLLSIECRDRGRPVGVPDIEAFHKKCERTGIDRGVFLSATGFANTAIKKAAGLNIGCLSLDEVGQFDWCQAPAVDVIRRNLINASAHVVFPVMDTEHRQIELEDGTFVSYEMVRAWAFNAMDQLQRTHALGDNDIEGEISKTFVEHNPALYYSPSAGGARVRAQQLQITSVYQIEHKLVPFEFHRYFDMARGKLIGEAAIAPVLLPDGGGADVVLRKTPEELLEVSVVPRPEKSRKRLRK
jgi:hypothetical protein